MTQEEKRNDDGTKSVAYYQDGEGNPVDKESAVRVEIVQYGKDGEETLRTYLTKDGR